MDYLHPKTLELLMYILFEGDLIEEPPYKFATKVFGSDMNYIFDELEKNRIDDCFEIGNTATYYSRSGEPKEYNGVTLSHYNKLEVEGFLDKYIDEFKEDKLQSPQNYYLFEDQISIIINSILKPYYKKSKYNFSIDYNFDDADFSCARDIIQKDLSTSEFKTEVQKDFRLYETLLYLNKEGLIKINKGFKCVELKEDSKSESEEKKYVLSINITLKETPIKISRRFSKNLCYGEMEINVNTGESCYKENKYHFDSEGTTFKLLCHVI
jgi:hypothetical protein